MVESDEDVPVQHTVSTLVDMPEVSFLSQGHYGRSLSKSLAIPCKEWIRAGRVTAPRY